MSDRRRPLTAVSRPVRLWLEARYFRWLDRRTTAAPRQRLHIGNLYIFPTASGFAFVGLAALIWLLGTNYQNNLILGLAYLQLSLFMVLILATYHNLARIEIALIELADGPAGAPLTAEISVHTPRAGGADNVALDWGAGRQLINLDGGRAERVAVELPAGQRGRYWARHLLITSRFPLGLVRCWSHINLAANCWVYPAARPGASPPTNSGQQNSGRAPELEYEGLANYAPGDSPRRIDWRQYARRDALVVKRFSGGGGAEQELDFADYYRGDAEAALAELATACTRLNASGASFSLRLPAGQLAAAGGGEHLAMARRWLAAYPDAPT